VGRIAVVRVQAAERGRKERKREWPRIGMGIPMWGCGSPVVRYLAAQKAGQQRKRGLGNAIVGKLGAQNGEKGKSRGRVEKGGVEGNIPVPLACSWLLKLSSS
jgi:hypothetical protein